MSARSGTYKQLQPTPDRSAALRAFGVLACAAELRR
jgi:hypothetical protein